MQEQTLSYTTQSNYETIPRDCAQTTKLDSFTFLTMGDEITEPISMENLGNEDCHEIEEPSLLERLDRVRFESKGTSEQVDVTKQDIFVELESEKAVGE